MPKSHLARRATIVVLAGNMLLLALKALATSYSDSLTIFSETVNSLTDVAASIAVLICVRVGLKGADAKHPFGHRRAEPIAGLIVAIFTGIMGWEVVHSPLAHLAGGGPDLYIGPFPLPVLIATVVLKMLMVYYLRGTAKSVDSPALRASATDCRNDVLVAAVAIGGVLAGSYVSPTLDAVTALVIGGYILYQAYDIGAENVNYLMGSTPDAALLERIRASAAGVPGVLAVRDIKAHYVGNFVHVELAIVLDGTLSTLASHEIAEAAHQAVEAIRAIDEAFIHVEPVVPKQEARA